MLQHRKSTGSRKYVRTEIHLAQSLWTFLVAAAVAGFAIYQISGNTGSPYQSLTRDPAVHPATHQSDLPAFLPPELNSSRF